MAKTNKQQLLLEYLVSSPDTFALCKSIIHSDFFDPEYRKTVEFIHSYYDKYNSTPSPDQIDAETGVELQLRQVTRDEIKYCSEEIETFCRRKAIERAILASPSLIEKGDYGKVENIIRDAISTSLNKDLGVDYFEDPASRLEAMLQEAPRTTTKWKLFDEMIGGGIARTEMLMFSANSGGGKSIALANLALNMTSQGFNVLYLSLELSEKMISQRFDMMLTGIPTVNWRNNVKEISASLNQIAPHMGKLVIKRMESGTNCNAIRGYLKEFELKNGYIPDLLVVDYLDIMGANEKVSADNIFEKDKRAAEQLRDIGFDYDMFIATASQQNRSAIEANELHQGHIAGGLSKVNTVDVYCSVILTPTMKAAGEIGFTFLKTRSSDGVGKTIYLKWDNNSLRILNAEENDDRDDEVITSKIAKSKKSKAASLQDLMSI
jgi:KaiC/GvpD/RAD55 family RecA-like ATPase